MTPGLRLLQVEGVAFTPRGRSVLEDASLSVTPGRITALMGRNGAGKTTLFRAAAGRVRTKRGRVVWDGEVVSRPSLASMARRGLFYGDQDSLLTRGFTVAQHVDALCAVYGSRRRAHAIDAMDMGSCLTRRPRRISGGERRRATLAMAMMRAPRCLLMDEPFASISPRDRERIAGGLRELRSDGCAIAISGHDVEDLLAVADTVVWLHGGTTRLLGIPSAARADRAFQRDYLGRSAEGSQGGADPG